MLGRGRRRAVHFRLVSDVRKWGGLKAYREADSSDEVPGSYVPA